MRISKVLLTALVLSSCASLPVSAADTPAPIVTQEIPNTLVKFDLVRIPGGTFIEAGPDGKPHKVELKPFLIGKTEVTWDEFDVYAFRLDLSQEDQAKGVDAASRPSKPYGAPDRGFGHAGYPALAMTFHSAQEYCNWLSKKTGKKFRLPTETEWEWAARANKLDAKPLEAAELEKLAWYWDTTEDKTQAVATKAPNPWGLYDTLGNVWEWTTGKDGVPAVRGGGYLSKIGEVHPGARQTQQPAWNENDPQNPKSRWWLSNATFVGLRVVCEE